MVKGWEDLWEVLGLRANTVAVVTSFLVKILDHNTIISINFQPPYILVKEDKIHFHNQSKKSSNFERQLIITSESTAINV